MFDIFKVTLNGVFRDRVFQGILMVAVVFTTIPSISSLSMRQVTESSLTLSLSLFSFIMLLLAVFLGGTSLWKDIDRRYTFGIISLPVSRGGYLLGKFAGIAGFMFLSALVLGLMSAIMVLLASGMFPPERAVVWGYFCAALFFDALKYVMLVAFAFLFSTVSTSFFLPIFGTISTFLVGSASQEVYDYLHSPLAASVSPLVRRASTALYYLLPNFSAFDLKVNAIYGVTLSLAGIALTFGYFLVYTAALLTLSTLIFSRREMQ